MTLRLVFALGAGLGCGLLGMRRAAHLVRREKELRLWLEALARLQLLLEEGASTLPAALERAAVGENGVGKCLRTIAETLRAQPTLDAGQVFATEGGRFLTWAQGEERRALGEMMAGISHGTLALRRQAVEHACAWLHLCLENAAGKREKDGKLAITLGWTAGVCLVLLLL